MREIITKKLPHGTIPFEQIHDPQVRDVLMKLNENQRALDKRLAAVEKATREIQRRA